MIHRDGSLFHIDYGFMLQSAPGRGIKMETPIPFKLSAEMVKVMGGPGSKVFKRFKKKMVDGLLRLHNQSAKLLLLVNMVAMSNNDLSCFERGDTSVAIQELEDRLWAKSEMNEKQATKVIDDLIKESENNWRMQAYDGYQFLCNNIF